MSRIEVDWPPPEKKPTARAAGLQPLNSTNRTRSRPDREARRVVEAFVCSYGFDCHSEVEAAAWHDYLVGVICGNKNQITELWRPQARVHAERPGTLAEGIERGRGLL